jgi:hypothetical protein
MVVSCTVHATQATVCLVFETNKDASFSQSLGPYLTKLLGALHTLQVKEALTRGRTSHAVLRDILVGLFPRHATRVPGHFLPGRDLECRFQPRH